MAKTVDEVTIKVGVEGQPSLDQLNTKLNNIEKSTKSAADSFKSFNTRTLSANIQDIAVQAELGVDWMRILGQQGSEVLAAFGPAGAAAGAALAVGVAIARPVLDALGVDMRNLKEMTDDLAKSTDSFVNAQKQNQSTLIGLGNAYNTLTPAAKAFFDVKERLMASKAERESITTINELKSSYAALSEEAVKSARAQATSGSIALSTYLGAGATAGIAWKRAAKGLTEEQGYAVAKMMKNIDANAPEKTVIAINDILNYLDEVGPKADNFKQSFEKTAAPLIKVNEELIKQKTNIREATEYASIFNAQMMLLSTFGNSDASGMAEINAAKRNFDQITAIKKEGALKFAEFDLQLTQKENQTGTKLEAERTAFRLKNEQEIADKVKDFNKGQYETYRSASLTNEAKQRSLDLESQLNKLQDDGRYALAYQVQYQSDLAKNAKDYNDTVVSIGEQLRKNTITTAQSKLLEQDAAAIRDKADKNAEEARRKRINDAKDAQRATVFEMDTKLRAIGYDEDALKIRQGMRNMYGEEIDYQVKIASLKNAQAEAELKINEQKNLGKISESDAADQVSRTRIELLKALDLEEKRTAEAMRYRTASFGEGATDAVAKIMNDNLTMYQQAGKMVESVYANMGNAIDKFVDTGKFKFSDFRDSVIRDLIKIQLKADITKAIGGGLSFLGVSLPGRAVGGPVDQNSPYMVGEQGPELFIPQTSGTIIPNNALGNSQAAAATPTNVTYNINAVDAMSFKQMVAADPSFMYAVTLRGQQMVPGAR